jgi:hypothetical protein
MSYEATIRCDVRKGNPIKKQRCHSDAQARAPQPRADRATSRHAVLAVERDALDMGWKRVRRASRSAEWVCPVCVNEG